MQHETFTATYSVVTPLYLGGGEAGQHATDIRPPSIKGALRFWWRAVHWGRFLADAGTEVDALKALHQAEARLFGTAASTDTPKLGQSRVLLTARLSDGIRAEQAINLSRPGIRYLAGMGLTNTDRTALWDGVGKGRLTVEITFHKETTPEQKREVRHALLALGLFGGLGARARRGFGSLAVESIEGLDLLIPDDADSLKALIPKLLGGEGIAPTLPPFSAFSRETRVDVAYFGECRRPLDMLERVGQRFSDFRKSDAFRDDRTLVLRMRTPNKPETAPERAIFGIPHNYYFPRPQNFGIEIGGPNKDRDRRASPLLIHIHRFPDGQLAALQMLLAARFLPQGDRLQMGKLHSVPIQADFQPIRDYLNQCNARRVFPHDAA